MKDLTLHWKPFTPGANQFTKYRFSPPELYADAISVLVNDPTLLRKIAPTFEKAFFSYLQRKPEVRDIYYGIQRRIKNPEAVQQQRQENIRGMFERGEKAKKETERRPLLDIFHSLRLDLIDKNADLIAKVEKAIKAGRIIDDSQNPVYWVEQLPYLSGEIYHHLRGIDAEVIAPLKAEGMSLDDLGEYMMLKRITGDRAELANPLGHTTETAQAGLDSLRQQLGDEKFQKLEVAVQKYRAIREQNVIKLVAKAGCFEGNGIEGFAC